MFLCCYKMAYLPKKYNYKTLNISLLLSSADELSASVLEEWKKMKRQQKLSSTLSSPVQNDHIEQQKPFSFQNSPTQFNMLPYGNNFNGYFPNLNIPEAPSKSGKEQPMFTAKQVVMVCERLWKEREDKLREEYDHVLHERLSGEIAMIFYAMQRRQHQNVPPETKTANTCNINTDLLLLGSSCLLSF